MLRDKENLFEVRSSVQGSVMSEVECGLSRTICYCVKGMT